MPRPVVPLLLAFAALSLGLCPKAQAQRTEASRQLVFLDSVEPFKRDRKHFVAIKGKAPDLPVGTRVEFLLTWRSRAVEVFTFEMVAGGKIQAEFQIRKAPRTRGRLYFRSVIEARNQTGAVRKALASRPAIFNPALDPWTQHHNGDGLQFRLLTRAEQESALEPLRKKFLGYLAELTRLESDFAQQHELASLGEAYSDRVGQFDGDAWQRWFDQVVTARLHQIVAEAAEMQQEARFYPYQRSLAAISHLCHGLARRCFARAVALYRVHQSAPPAAYVEEQGFDFKPLTSAQLALTYEVADTILRRDLGLIPTDEVEDAFDYIIGGGYEGILFRPLEAQEIAHGAFGPWRKKARWQPESALLATLESELVRFVEASDPPLTSPGGLRFLRRQYLGLEIDGGKFVLVNLVSGSAARSSEFIRRVIKPAATDLTFALLYDTAKQTFSPPPEDSQ